MKAVHCVKALAEDSEDEEYQLQQERIRTLADDAALFVWVFAVMPFDPIGIYRDL